MLNSMEDIGNLTPLDLLAMPGLDATLPSLAVPVAEDDESADPCFGDYSSIKPGDVLTYKELTSRLGIKYLGGNAKKKQLDKLSCLMKFTKKSNKIYIQEVYNLSDQEKYALYLNFSASDKYIQNIMNVLALYIYSKNKSEVFLTIPDLAFICGFYNTTFNNFRNDYKKLSDMLQKNEQDIEDFVNRVFTYIYTTINRALDTLTDKRILRYTKSIVIYEPDSLDPYGIDVGVREREATSYEMEQIISREKEVLEEMGKEYYSSLFFTKNGYYNYWVKVRQLVHEDFPEWYSWKHCIKIISPKHIISKLANEILSNQSKHKINEQMIHHLYKQADKIYEKGQDISQIRYPAARYNLSWLNDQYEITDSLIPVDES